MRDALAVVAALSSGGDRLLEIELSEHAPERNNVTQAELVNKLNEWLRDRTLSDEEWREWTSKVEISWVPVQAGKAFK